MSKISNSLLMIRLLSNGRVYSVKELSLELGVTERMVRYYKEQLEMAGYVIETFKGPGGGYFMDKNNLMNIDNFNKNDLNILDRTQKELMSSEDEELKRDFRELNKKLRSIYNANKVFSEYKNISINVNSTDDKIKIINDCIKNKRGLFIDYLGTSGRVTRRDIYPIYMFEFEYNIYLASFCKLRGAMRIFTLSKILNCIIK